jgi:hypothetical protein
VTLPCRDICDECFPVLSLPSVPQIFLGEEQLAEGFMLPCVTYAQSDLVVSTHHVSARCTAVGWPCNLSVMLDTHCPHKACSSCLLMTACPIWYLISADCGLASSLDHGVENQSRRMTNTLSIFMPCVTLLCMNPFESPCHVAERLVLLVGSFPCPPSLVVYHH